MIENVYNQTGITADFEKEFTLEAWRTRPAAIQISWSNLTGTNDGTIVVKTRLSSSHNYATLETITMSAETDNTAYIAVDLFCKEVKLSYTANNITSVDMLITAAE